MINFTEIDTTIINHIRTMCVCAFARSVASKVLRKSFNWKSKQLFVFNWFYHLTKLSYTNICNIYNSEHFPIIISVANKHSLSSGGKQMRWGDGIRVMPETWSLTVTECFVCSLGIDDHYFGLREIWTVCFVQWMLFMSIYLIDDNKLRIEKFIHKQMPKLKTLSAFNWMVFCSHLIH